MNIAIACGGTGGHLFPGMAVGRVLQEQGHDVVLWVSGRDVESAGLTRWEGDTIEVPSQGFSGGRSTAQIKTVFSLIRAVLRARSQMRRRPPDALLAMGSYASVGPVLAARSLGVPVVLHEANAVPGKAIRFLSRFAREVCTTFEGTAAHFSKSLTCRTGLPVTVEVSGRDRGPDDVFCVLVAGGSQGAAVLNEAVPLALAALVEEGRSLRVVHLSGRGNEDRVRAAYASTRVSHEVLAFSNDMARLYTGADLAICRAGAGTSCELALHGLPAILVPHPTAGGGHQSENARELQTRGGAVMMLQAVLTPDHLAKSLGALMDDSDLRQSMRLALEAFARPDASEQVAKRMLHYAGSASA